MFLQDFKNYEQSKRITKDSFPLYQPRNFGFLVASRDKLSRRFILGMRD
jgi:hypothetical protein